MQQPLDDDSFHLTEENLVIAAPQIFEYNSNAFEEDNDGTDQLIDCIDLENDSDVVEFLGVILDG